MTRIAQYKPNFSIAAALCMLFFPCIVQAQITVTPTVTMLNTDTFHYDYTITNNTTNDLFDVSIHVLPGAGQVFNVTAPTGFASAYDSGLGLVDYTEDTGTFTTGDAFIGFTYDSFLAPQTSFFEANQVDLSNSNGGSVPADIITTTGVTLAAVPEPGSLALLCAGSAVSLLALRRRRNRSK